VLSEYQEEQVMELDQNFTENYNKTQEDSGRALTASEIAYARSIIREMHPLRNLDIDNVLPFLEFLRFLKTTIEHHISIV
jgi:hypothetical protein